MAARILLFGLIVLVIIFGVPFSIWIIILGEWVDMFISFNMCLF